MSLKESETLELKRSTSELKEAVVQGLTVARITTEMVSERRNELLAEMLQRVRLTEKWGRGIKLILSKEPGTIFPDFRNGTP